MGASVNNPWPGPAGLIPVTSGRADDANIWNRNYLDSIHVEMRVIDAVKPTLETSIFGEAFSSPIMMPAFSHLNKIGENGRTPMEEYALAARETGVVNWVGMEPDEEFMRIAQTGARTVRIIKPFADHDLIRRQAEFAQAHGAIAVGIDIDHIVGKDGGFDVVDGQPLGPVTQADLASYAAEASVPFVAKGVLSVRDAAKAVKAGCAAIVVSHHHGRIPFGIPPVSVLPDIRRELTDSNVAIFCDCGIDTGYDAYKALALGADAVSVGRGILKPLLKEGTAGVKKKFASMNAELAELMMYTDVANTASFDSSVLHL